MTAFRINDDEQTALRSSHLSHAAKVLYVVGIRPRMDFRTGIVGKARRVSYQAFHEDLEFIPAQGSTRPPAAFNQAAIRALLTELERAGLVRRLPNDHRAIYLECLVADREDASKKVNNRGTTHKNSRGTTHQEASIDGLFCGYPHGMNDTPDEGMNNTPPVSGVHQFSVVNLAAARRLPVVDNSSAAAAAATVSEIAAWMRAAEALRIGGAVPMIQAADEHIGRWVCKGVDAATLARAYDLAVAARQRDGSAAPISPAFLDRFIAEAQTGGARTLEDRARAVGVPALPGQSSEEWRRAVVEAEGLVLEGQRLGVFRNGREPLSEFRARVVAARQHGEVTHG